MGNKQKSYNIFIRIFKQENRKEGNIMNIQPQFKKNLLK